MKKGKKKHEKLKRKRKSRGNNKIRNGGKESERKQEDEELEALTLIVRSEKQEIRKCFMLISMEISVISPKWPLPALIWLSRAAPPPLALGWSAPSHHGSTLAGPKMAPRCAQAS